MAMADYYLCDVCGGKAFYDSNLNYDLDNIDPVTGKYPLEYVGDMAVICKMCAKTHRVVIVEIEEKD